MLGSCTDYFSCSYHPPCNKLLYLIEVVYSYTSSTCSNGAHARHHRVLQYPAPTHIAAFMPLKMELRPLQEALTPAR